MLKLPSDKECKGSEDLSLLKRAPLWALFPSGTLSGVIRSGIGVCVADSCHCSQPLLPCSEVKQFLAP